jgi:hypothetical protein
MTSDKLNSKAYFKALSILHLAMVAGVVFFGLIVALLVAINTITSINSTFTNFFYYVVPVLTILGLIASNIVFKNRLKQTRDNYELRTRMTNYRGALIIKYALLEGPAIFAIIASLITGTISFLAYAGLMVVLMLYARPGIQKTFNDLVLDEKDKVILEDPNGVIE